MERGGLKNGLAAPRGVADSEPARGTHHPWRLMERAARTQEPEFSTSGIGENGRGLRSAVPVQGAMVSQESPGAEAQGAARMSAQAGALARRTMGASALPVLTPDHGKWCSAAEKPGKIDPGGATRALFRSTGYGFCLQWRLCHSMRQNGGDRPGRPPAWNPDHRSGHVSQR